MVATSTKRERPNIGLNKQTPGSYGSTVFTKLFYYIRSEHSDSNLNFSIFKEERIGASGFVCLIISQLNPLRGKTNPTERIASPENLPLDQPKSQDHNIMSPVSH